MEIRRWSGDKAALFRVYFTAMGIGTSFAKQPFPQVGSLGTTASNWV